MPYENTILGNSEYETIQEDERLLDNMSDPISAVPDSSGRFGEFGGRYVPETLTRALDELAEEYAQAKQDPEFQSQLTCLIPLWAVLLHFILLND